MPNNVMDVKLVSAFRVHAILSPGQRQAGRSSPFSRCTLLLYFLHQIIRHPPPVRPNPADQVAGIFESESAHALRAIWQSEIAVPIFKKILLTSPPPALWLPILHTNLHSLQSAIPREYQPRQKQPALELVVPSQPLEPSSGTKVQLNFQYEN